MARIGPARRKEAPVGASKVQPASATAPGAFTSPPTPSSSSWLGALPSPERFSKYLRECTVVISLALLFELQRTSLEPIYNSIPLNLNASLRLGLLGGVSALVLLLLGAPRDEGAACRRSGACFPLAALCIAVAGVYGRRLGNDLADRFGPQWGAFAARTVLGLGAGVATAVHASAAGDGRWYRRLRLGRLEEDAASGHAVRVVLQVIPFVVAVRLAELVWPTILGLAPAALTKLPETMIILLSIPTSMAGLIDLSRARLASPHAAANSVARWAYTAIVLIHMIFLYTQRSATRLTLSQPEFPYHAANGTLHIISSERSVTGQIVVADDLERGMRFLRCDASLLGGRWYGSVPDGPGRWRTEFADSIFATFPLQEIGMFAHRPDETDTGARALGLAGSSLDVEPAGQTEAKEPERALIIGLGVGIAASAFAQQGYTVDIVEIDPLVYRAAADHFGLVASPNGTVNIEDGAAYVKTIAKQRRAGKYDGQKWNLVVQDCFTGGSVPGEMFTREFWADLKENVAEDGVVAMNFVGLRHTKASRAVLVTLLSSFAQCRAFDESINMVVICSASHSPLLTFRQATPADIRDSPLRQHVYTTFHGSETRMDDIVSEADFGDKSLMLKRGKQRLNAWQVETGLSTWRMIRQILTPEMWLAY